MTSLLLGRNRFLVVDGSRYMRDLIRSMLVRLGASDIVEAATTDKAFETFAFDRPDLVICDSALSPMDGLAFVRMLKAKAKHDATPLSVILTLSQVDQAAVMEAKSAGPDYILAKPFSADALLKRILACASTTRSTEGSAKDRG